MGYKDRGRLSSERRFTLRCIGPCRLSSRPRRRLICGPCYTQDVGCVSTEDDEPMRTSDEPIFSYRQPFLWFLW